MQEKEGVQAGHSNPSNAGGNCDCTQPQPTNQQIGENDADGNMNRSAQHRQVDPTGSAEIPHKRRTQKAKQVKAGDHT